MDEETIWEIVWPVVTAVIEATMREDETAVISHLAPGGTAADLGDLFGLTVFDILLKTTLGHDQLNLTQVVETEEGVIIEFAWEGPAVSAAGMPVDKAVCVLLRMVNGRFRITDINPSSLNLYLTEARARAVLATAKILSQRDVLSPEPWVLPLTLYGGLLPLPLRPASFRDAVEVLLLPGLQAREYGVLSLVKARRLWRDFKAAQPLPIGQPADWAAAVEWVMSEQNSRAVRETAVAQYYTATPAKLRAHAIAIKHALSITGVDPRYAEWQMVDVFYQEES